MHLSLFAWISVGLGIVTALWRFALVGYIIKRTERSERSEYSNFSSWMVFGGAALLLSLPALFLIRPSICGCDTTEYFYVYWVLGVLYLVLEFGVIYELVVNALKPYSALIDLGKMLFTWAIAFLVIASSLTAFTTVGSHATKLAAAAAVTERSLRLIECGILLLFFFFERRLGLSWRNTNVSIALGLGLSAAVDLCASYLKGAFVAENHLIDCVNAVFFLGVLTYWSYCFARKPQGERANVLDSPSRLIFQRWNEVLASYACEPAAAGLESFLPNVERTVERVLARKMVN